MFTFGNCIHLTSPASAGDVELMVDSAPRWPRRGRAVISASFPIEEPVDFVVAEGRLVLSQPLKNEHERGSFITLIGEQK